MENKHIEVEGDELLLESSEGHYAIIPFLLFCLNVSR